MKKYLSFVLALVLVLTSIAFTASADEIKDLRAYETTTREMESWCYHYSQQAVDLNVLSNFYDHLLTNDSNGALVSCIAKEWSSPDGGETWAYHPMLSGNTKFQFVNCWQEGKELYLFGNYGGGYGEAYLMRVRADQALEPSAYRYFAGLDSTGEPLWSLSETEAAVVLNYSEREIGITYNAYLNHYLMTGWDSFNGLMVIHESPTLFGPWSEAFVLLPRQYTPVENKDDAMSWIYGAYTLPGMVENGGKSMYFTLSEYKPYQVYWMRVDFQKRNE